MKSSWSTHNIKNWSTTLTKMNCLLALIHFKSKFHFHTPWKHRFFWCIKEVCKWNIGLKMVEVILNNFLNGYQIFICSYPQAKLYSTGLQLWMGPEPTTFRLRDRHTNHYTNDTFVWMSLSLNVNFVGLGPIYGIQ